MKLEIDGFTLVGETYGEFFDKPELEVALDVYEKEVFTHQEKNDLEIGIVSQTSYHRIYAGEWVFDGRSVDAVRFIEEESE